jgi:nucleoside 2-deoxyribosyltransferase
VQEYNLKGVKDIILCLDSRADDTGIKLQDFIKEFPDDPIDRFKRGLLNLSRHKSLDPFGDFEINETLPYKLFAKDEDKARKILEYMAEDNLIAIEDKKKLGSLTYKGWTRIAELQEQYKEHSAKAFLAMWFNETTKSFRAAAKLGAELAGYKLLVVDEEHHNDFIMNKVLNMIDDSKFVIADFSCAPESTDDNGVKNGVRGGVYYEAGFASGQGKEVIMTCKDDSDSSSRRHFDIEQKNTIFWKEEEGKVITSNGNFDFAVYLKERIIRSVGKGPGYSEK